MKIIVAVSLFLTCFVAYVSADCYMQPGCSDPKLKKTLKENDTWRPSSNRCYSCRCFKTRTLAKICFKEDKTPKFVNVRKSSLSQRISQAKLDTSVSDYEEIEISESEVDTFQCPPVRAPTFNYKTWTFEDIKYKRVYYVYDKKTSRCCSRFINFTNVSPACKVVKVTRCRSKVVLKSNPKKRCNAPMSMVG